MFLTFLSDLGHEDAFLGVCKGVPVGKGSLLGRVDTTARLTFGNALPSGEGQIALHDAVFKAGPPASGLIVRAASAARLRCWSNFLISGSRSPRRGLLSSPPRSSATACCLDGPNPHA